MPPYRAALQATSTSLMSSDESEKDGKSGHYEAKLVKAYRPTHVLSLTHFV